jgi:hypothetical protein
MKLSVNRINGVIIIGVFLATSGLIGPWFSFDRCDREVGECYSITMSPFIFTVEISDFNSPNRDAIDHQVFYLKQLDEVSIGVVCVLGSLLSLYGVTKKRLKLALYGGCIVVISVLAFSIVLPVGASGFTRMSIGWGAYVTLSGALLMIVSSIIDVFLSRPS